jgi:hypothetical protein
MAEADPGAGGPVLSLVLCSRNDQFQGNSRWRLETALNYVAAHLAELGRLGDAEIIVADWGSEHPLRDALVLTEEAAWITQFLMIPTALAKGKQRDSPFAEVFAINAAVRRARGEYIGRIDQDTLVGSRFLKWFFAAADGAPGSPEIESAAMISNRRRVPYHLAVRCPEFPVIRKYVDELGRRGLLPRTEVPPKETYWQCYIGIIMFHRKLWEACEGYDESFIYYGYMEFDLFLRLRKQHEGLDIGELVGWDFYHLDHVPAWFAGRKLARRTNPIRTADDIPDDVRVNGPGWGLGDYELALEPQSAGAPRASAERVTWQPSSRWELARASVASGLRTAGQIAFEYGKYGSAKAGRELAGRIRPQKRVS